MLVMAGEAALAFLFSGFPCLGNLVGMTAEAGGDPRLARKILVRCPVANDALDPHQPVFAVEPGLFLAGMAFSTFLVFRGGRMFSRGPQHRLRLHQQTQANQYDQSVHGLSLSPVAAAATKNSYVSLGYEGL